jgi:nucleoside 2-deoxyribosyltransferase
MPAFNLAVGQSAILMRAGVPVFSPIVHTHPIAMQGKFDTLDLPFWLRVDQPMMDAAAGIIMLTAPTWEKSRGMAHELDVFKAAGKPVYWMRPGEVRGLVAQLCRGCE